MLAGEGFFASVSTSRQGNFKTKRSLQLGNASGVFAFLVSFCSVLRKMDWVSLHLCFLFCHFLWGGRSASPPDALGVFACVVFFVIFCLLLMFFLRDVLGSYAAVRGGNFKQKKAEGGLVGGAARPPQMHWVSLHVLFFFRQFCLLLVFFLPDVLGSNVAVRGGNLKQKKAGGGLGGGRSASPQMHWVSLHVLFFLLFFIFFFLCFFFVMFLEAMWQ